MKTTLEAYELLKPKIRDEINRLKRENEALAKERDAYLKQEEKEKGWNRINQLIKKRNECWDRLNKITSIQGDLENMLGAIIAITNDDVLDYGMSVKGAYYSFYKSGGTEHVSLSEKVEISKVPARYQKCNLCSKKHPLIYREVSESSGHYGEVMMICNREITMFKLKYFSYFIHPDGPED